MVQTSQPLTRRFVSVIIGIAGGIASGLLGVGGGFVVVPLQVAWLRQPQRIASGTSLAAILPIGLASAVVYYFGVVQVRLDLGLVLLILVESAVGAYAGARIASIADESILRLMVTGMLALAAAKEVFDAVANSTPHISSLSSADPSITATLLLLVAGLLVGLLSGLTGLGGGIFLVPLFVVGFGIGQREAQGDSLLVILPTAVVGALAHYRNGNVDVKSGLWIAAAGVPAALIGAALALVTSDRVLVTLFAIFLVVAAIRTAPWPRRKSSNSVDD